MAAIDGLMELQCETLAQAQIGQLILLERYPKQNASEGQYDELGSDSDSDSATDTDIDTDTEDSPEHDGGGEVQAAESGDEVNARSAEEGAEELEGAELDDESEDGSEDSAVNFGLTTSAELYVIHEIIKDETGTMIGIGLRPLTYIAKLADVGKPAYHVYGQDVIRSGQSFDAIEDTTESISSLVSDKRFECDLSLDPTGDDVRSIIFHGRCPANCRGGWFPSQEEVQAMISEPIAAVTAYAPVCPVCIGKPSMQEYHGLREVLDAVDIVDIGAVVECLGRLNPRRAQLRYSFWQFDERAWNHMFYDMPSEDEEEEVGRRDDDRYEHWAEAMDPNSNISFHPASHDAIAGLPRMTFEEHQQMEECTTCLVCQEDFATDTMVVELPCGHIFCDAGCAEQWLKNSNSCPTCRVKLPAKGGEPVQDATITDIDVANEDPKTRTSAGVDKDGDDTMLNVIEA